VHLPWRHIAPAPDLPPLLTSLLAEEAARLAGLANGTNVLEIGSAYGYSAIVMARGGASTVTAVDPHTWIPGSQAVMEQAVNHAGLTGRVQITARTSQDTLPHLPGRFGLVFVDGDHQAAAVEHDLAWAVKLAAPGGVVAVHDYGEDCCCPDVRATCDRLYPGRGTVTGTLWEMRV
jgi:cyclopropane fatty-acyl-phospholipid synthase-like methyltransferase